MSTFIQQKETQFRNEALRRKHGDTSSDGGFLALNEGKIHVQVDDVMAYWTKWDMDGRRCRLYLLFRGSKASREFTVAKPDEDLVALKTAGMLAARQRTQAK